jgi:hypothetical protein
MSRLPINPFVDLQKRSVDLPEGCKDLFDTLQTTTRQADSRSRYKLVNSLQETERFLAGLLLAPTKLTFISINLARQQHHLQICPVLEALCTVLRIDSADKARLQRVRKSFRNADISAIDDSFGGIANGAPFRTLIYPLPIIAPDAAQLIARVLREGFAVPEKSTLYVSYSEQAIAKYA